ncbi:MAG: gamma-glutamyltransferase [Myxococcales bacterium]|nr:gamma-glutamyltransferase [Myxococcales bacterium]
MGEEGLYRDDPPRAPASPGSPARRGGHWALLGLLLAAAACGAPTPAVENSPGAARSAGAASDAPPTPATPARRLPNHDPANEPGVAVGIHGAVSSAEGHASRIGLDVLKRGGNAVDAAVAVGLALAVTHPTAGNLGGGGFMILRTAKGERVAIDYRETAPLAAHADMYLKSDGEVGNDSVLGPRAAGIPGTVAGLGLAHARHGSLPWSELVAPALALARDGHTIDARHAESMARAVKRMRDAGFEATAKLFEVEGKALAEGALWKQPELAQTLGEIASGGAEAFYQGPLAERIVKGVEQLGGIFSLEDLARYRAVIREPIVFDYRGYTIISMPPPSAGGVVLRQILAASELLKIESHPWRSAAAHHLYVEASRRAYADRNYLLGDPDFADVPTAALTDLDYIKKRMANIDATRATPSSEIDGGNPLAGESHETTHYSVVDEAGNAVSNTYTLNTGFGAKVAIPGTGILLNNEMDDFAAKPGSPNTYGLIQGKQNRIEPGKRMLSSMTPTIIEHGGELRAVLGTPGGPTISTTVVQIARALIDYGKPLHEAVAAARIHHQWMPDRVLVEPGAEAELRSGLEALGHQVAESRWGSIGHANCIEVDPDTRGFRAVADVARKGGEALAY